MTETKRKHVPIHSHRHCVDCGRFIKTVRCGWDHDNSNIKGYLCDPCFEKGDDYR